jgi:hypothetical protein
LLGYKKTTLSPTAAVRVFGVNESPVAPTMTVWAEEEPDAVVVVATELVGVASGGGPYCARVAGARAETRRIKNFILGHASA